MIVLEIDVSKKKRGGSKIIIRKLRAKTWSSALWADGKNLYLHNIKGIKPSDPFLRVKLVIASQNLDLLAFIPRTTIPQSKQRERKCVNFWDHWLIWSQIS